MKNSLPVILRSSVFAVVITVYAFLYSFICILALPLPLRMRNDVVMCWTRSVIWLIKVICKVNYEVEGLEHIPQNRCGIIFSKHQSAWETFFLPAMFRNTAIIAKRELLWIPFFGWGLKVTSPITINRANKSSAMAQIIKKGKAALKRGRWILIFPEGTRIAYGEIGNYRLGGTRLAVATGCPVLPVAHNAGLYWPKKGFIIKPGTVKIVFGPLIETPNLTPEEVLERAKEWIETTMKTL